MTESLPQDFTDTVANFAPTYSASASYAVGDYVIHNGLLYRCTTAIASGEAWTSGHWTQVNVGGEVSDLKSATDDATYKINNKIPSVLDSDGTADLDITDPSGNVIVRLENGHIVTKNFNSADLIKDSEATGTDLDIVDPYGHVLGRFADGGIVTKVFDGRKYVTYSVRGTAASGQGLTLTITRNFKAGDRLVLHIERGAMPWEDGVNITYKHDNTTIVSARCDCSWYEYTLTEDAESISAVYAAGAINNGRTVTFEVSVLGDVPIRPTVVSIKKDGTGDYTNLRDALDAIGTSANDVLNPYRIEIYPGTYDVLEDYTEEEIQAAYFNQTGFVGPKLLNGMSLIGMGKPEEIILTASLNTTDYSSDVRNAISTLNLQGGGGIENLTILAENIRYCIHDDFHCPIGKVLHRTMKNIVLRAYGAMSYNPPHTYGAGIAQCGMEYEFYNVDFGHLGGLHTRPSLPNLPRVYLYNCKGYNFSMYDYLETTDPDDVVVYVFDNCDFTILSASKDPGADQTYPHIVIMGCGGSSPMYNTSPATYYNTADVQCAVKNSLPVGTAVEYYNLRSGQDWQKATALDKVYGVVAYQTASDTYIQTRGYIAADRAGLTGLSIGDYIGLDADCKLAKVNDPDAAIGKVVYATASARAFIKLKWRY